MENTLNLWIYTKKHHRKHVQSHSLLQWWLQAWHLSLGDLFDLLKGVLHVAKHLILYQAKNYFMMKCMKSQSMCIHNNPLLQKRRK